MSGTNTLLAQHEHETLSKRTKNALTAKKPVGPNSAIYRV